MPESIVVLRRFFAIADLFAFVLPVSAAPPLPEEFGGVFWGSMLALDPGPEGYMPGRYIHESRRDRGRPDDGISVPPLPQMLRGLALIALPRAQSDHQIFMTLTPEQRESLELARPAGARP